MAELKFPTLEELGRQGGEWALNEFEYKGHTIREWADKITAGEYQPVKHGHFERFSDDEQFKVLQEYGIPFNGICSICTSMMFDTDKFCGECGAEMDGGEEND